METVYGTLSDKYVYITRFLCLFAIPHTRFTFNKLKKIQILNFIIIFYKKTRKHYDIPFLCLDEETKWNWINKKSKFAFLK